LSSPLQVAIFRNHVDAAKVLLEAGADPMVVNQLGESHLYWAIGKHHTECRLLLESHGATLTRTDRKRLKWWKKSYGMEFP